MIQNFFIKAIDFLDHQATSCEGTKSGASLKQALDKATQETYDALCDSFNTRQSMAAISELSTAFHAADKSQLSASDVRDTVKWVTFMVNMFGLNGSETITSDKLGWSGVSIPEAAKHYVYPLSRVRDDLRRKARSSEGLQPDDLKVASDLKRTSSETTQSNDPKYAQIVETFANDVEALASSSNLSKEVLQLCDRLRDTNLWDQGIYLEDGTGNEPALVRPVTRELLAARQEKEERELLKQKAKEEREREAAAKAEKGRLSHLEMFRTTEYSAWDEEGLPLQDTEGKEVAKSKVKKLRKDWERQKKLHEAWLKSQT